jgi:cellobiose phosphorylase
MRAILHALRFGTHGLPLMGSGDVERRDDLRRHRMARAKASGSRSSLYTVLDAFARVARLRDGLAFAQEVRRRIEPSSRRTSRRTLGRRVGTRRAYFDDGTPLGSAYATASARSIRSRRAGRCLSGVASTERARAAMDAVYRHLVRQDACGLVQLLAPPFDRSTPYPGYIRGYVPGRARELAASTRTARSGGDGVRLRSVDASRAWELMSMINPVNTRVDPERSRLRVESYVVAAEHVCDRRRITGRGWWTWYTGSAVWMYG